MMHNIRKADNSKLTASSWQRSHEGSVLALADLHVDLDDGRLADDLSARELSALLVAERARDLQLLHLSTTTLRVTCRP